MGCPCCCPVNENDPSQLQRRHRCLLWVVVVIMAPIVIVTAILWCLSPAAACGVLIGCWARAPWFCYLRCRVQRQIAEDLENQTMAVSRPVPSLLPPSRPSHARAHIVCLPVSHIVRPSVVSPHCEPLCTAHCEPLCTPHCEPLCRRQGKRQLRAVDQIQHSQMHSDLEPATALRSSISL